MIARIWRATTKLADAEIYQAYLDRFVIPCCQAAEGNEGLFVLKECRGEVVHFLLLTLWASKEALLKYVGAEEDIVHPPTDEKQLLLAFESNARHYTVTRPATAEA
jgi:hypothetical protein